MNINDFVASNLAYKFLNEKRGMRAVESASASSEVESGLEKASQRIQSLVDTSTKQLSSVGYIKSAVHSAQLASIAVGRLTTTTSVADMRTTVNNFVAAFNGAVDATRTMGVAPGDRLASQNTEKLSNGLRRTVNVDTTTQDALRQAGLSLGSDGILVLDAKKFDFAHKSNPDGLRAALTRIGQNVEKFAAQELSATGNIGASMRLLERRSTKLQNQQTLLASSGQTPQQVQSRVSAAYLRFAPNTFQNG